MSFLQTHRYTGKKTCSSAHGIFQARTLKWFAIFSSRGSSTQGLNPCLLCILRRQLNSLPLSHLGILQLGWLGLKWEILSNISNSLFFSILYTILNQNSPVISSSFAIGHLLVHVSGKQPVRAFINSFQFSSVTQSCLTLYDPMDCSTRGLPVHHQLLMLAQTHVHQVSDAIHPSHPLSSPSPPAFNLSQHQLLFQWVSSSHQVAKVLELQHQSFQWIFRTDFLQDGLVGSPCSPRDSQGSSATPQFKSINSLVLSFLYGPTLTSIHDHWKNRSFDQTDLCWQSNVSDFQYAV